MRGGRSQESEGWMLRELCVTKEEKQVCEMSSEEILLGRSGRYLPHLFSEGSR